MFIITSHQLSNKLHSAQYALTTRCPKAPTTKQSNLSIRPSQFLVEDNEVSGRERLNIDYSDDYWEKR